MGVGQGPGAFADTLTRIGIGFTIAFVVGTGIGILMQNRWLNGFFRDAVTIGVTTPGLIWALITAIIFGNRPWGPMIAIVLTTFALISVNVAEGIKALPKDLIDMAKSFGVGVVRRNREIVIPHLAPYIFTGVSFGFSIAWKVTVLTEVFSSSSGIGFEMRTASQLFRLPEFLTWILAFYVLRAVPGEGRPRGDRAAVLRLEGDAHVTARAAARRTGHHEPTAPLERTTDR